MSALTVTGPWEWDADYRCKYAPTSDPRVVAVIERDEHAESPDGDLAPAYWASRHPGDPISHAAYMADPDAVAFIERFREADARLRDSATIDRWARVFHDTAIRVIPTQRYRNDDPLIVLDTPAFRALVGIEGGPDRAHLDGEIEELTAWLEGNVFGVGYGVHAGRVIDTGGSLDIEDYEITIECWGFYGETYAIETAERFDYGAPDLPTMLDLSLAGAQ